MASTAVTASSFAEHPAARAVPLEADVVKPETPVTEMSPLKTPSPGPSETPASQGMGLAQKDISERSNTQKQHLEQEESELKGGVTSTQDAAAAVAVMPAGPARCLARLSAAQQEEDTQESERLLSEGTREPSGSAVLNTAGGNLLRSTKAGFPRTAAKHTGSGSRLSDDCGSGRSDSQSTLGYNDEPDVSSSNADVLRVSVYNEESHAVVKTSTFAAAATMAVDQEAEAPSARKQTQRAQQQNEDDLLTSSLQAVLQHRKNVLEKASREMKEVLDLATQCKDREALAPKIQLLKEQLLAREQQHDAEKRELAAPVKALLSTTRCENEDEGAESALRRQIAQREHRNPQHEERPGSTRCSQTTQKEVVNKDDKQLSMSSETRVYLTDGKQDTEQQQQQQQEALPADSYTSAEKRGAPKPASTVGSWHPGSHDKESRAAQGNDKGKLSGGESTDKVSPKKELPLAVDTTQKKEAPKTAESSSKEASTSVCAREQKSKLTKEVEQPRQHQSKQQRQATDEEKETARRLRKNGTWWRQQVVNRLRLPGPNLSRKQFLSAFHHPETGVDTALLNAAFDRLKIIVYTDDGVAEEAVTVPHVLDLLEKTNGLNILHTLDAAELLEANVRCIDRKMTSQKTDLQMFAIRLMCRFFLAVSKKTLGELEITCRRVAPREAVRTYTEELESYRQTLIKAIAAEKNISIDQSTVVVSKCIHNMRAELQNDLVLLQCGPPQPTATQTEHPVIDLAKCRPQSLTVEKPIFSESGGGRPPPTRHAASAASAAPYKLSAAASPLAAPSQAATLPSVYPYGGVGRLATPGGPPFAAADFQGHPSAYVSVSSPAHRGCVAAAGAHSAATGVRYAPPGVVSSKGSPVVGTTLNPSAAASNPPLPSVAPTVRPTVVMSTEGAERHLKGSVSVPKLISASGDHGGKATDSEALGESSRRQARLKGVPSDKDTSDVPEKSGNSTTKFTTVAAAPAGMVAGCTATPAECLNQQQRETDLGNLVQIVEYRYADGTPVTNPAHLPEGAKAVEAAARARLEETARVAQQAARRAEAAALAQFTAATAAGGGGTAAASVAAAQYRRAFAALGGSNQESVYHNGTYPKINVEIEEFSNNPTDPTMHRVTPGMAAPAIVPQEEQQLQQGQQTVWKPQHVLAPTAVGGLLRPLPAAVVAATAARRPSALKPPNVGGVVGDTATAEGVATQKGDEINAASLQCVPSLRGRARGSYVLPPTDRAAALKDPATATEYSAAAGIVPPGFPAGAAGQLQALLQQQRLLTAMPNMVVSGAKLTTAGHDITRTPMPASAATRGTPPTSRSRVSRSLTPKTTHRDSFVRRSRGGCMGGSSPYRKSKRSSDSSIRASSVSSIQRAAGRFFASLGLWKSDGQDEEEDISSSPDAVPQVQDGLAAAAEQYLNGQQQQLQQQQQGQQGLVPQQFALQHQQQKLQQEQLQHQQHQLQQQQQHQHQLQPQQPLQQQVQHQQFQQHLQQAVVVSGPGTFPAVPPSRISTACGAPTTSLPNTVQGDGAAGRVGMYCMGSGVQLQSLRHYVAINPAEHTAADPRVYCTENAADKNFFPASSMLSAQQYRLAQQQKQQQDQQRQQHPRPHSGETWISTPSLLLRDVSGNLTAESDVSSQQRATENTRVAPMEKRFTATMESILAEAGEDEKKTAAAPAEKPTGYFAPPQQKDFASVQISGGEQQRDRQQGYTGGTEFTEKKAVTQQLHQNFLQQQRGAVVVGYNQATSRDTSVVTTHISQQTDSSNAMHTLHGLAYTAGDRAIQHLEGSQTMTSSSVAGQDAAVTGDARACQQGGATAVPSANLSLAGAGGSSVAGAAASASKAHQRSESSNAAPAAFSSTAAGFGALAASSRMPPQAEISNTVALSSSAVAAFPPAVVRTRVSSVTEVPSPQLGAQHIGNFAQVQAQLDSLTQRQVEAYAQQYGLYSTPQAAAAALGGVPLVGVGALGGPASCNGYAQFMSQHRPLPPVPPNYVFTKSS